jgi:hypothetical protein
MLFSVGMLSRTSDENARKQQVKVFSLDVGPCVVHGWRSQSLTV